MTGCNYRKTGLNAAKALPRFTARAWGLFCFACKANTIHLAVRGSRIRQFQVRHHVYQYRTNRQLAAYQSAEPTTPDHKSGMWAIASRSAKGYEDIPTGLTPARVVRWLSWDLKVGSLTQTVETKAL
jgi:hypothetical protein